MTDEKKPDRNKRFYPDLSQLASGKEGTEVNPELSGLFQRFMDKLKEDPSFGVGSHAMLDTRLPMLNGGLKAGDLMTFGLSTPGPYKSDIVGYMYRQKLAKKLELEEFIEKGVGTALEMHEKMHELVFLKRQLKGFEEITHQDIGAEPMFISPMPICEDYVGIRALKNPDGSLDINSFNFVYSPENELRAFHRRSIGKPMLAAAYMSLAMRNCISGLYEPTAEKELSQLAKERKHVPYQHPKKRQIKINPFLKGLVKRVEE